MRAKRAKGLKRFARTNSAHGCGRGRSPLRLQLGHPAPVEGQHPTLLATEPLPASAGGIRGATLDAGSWQYAAFTHVPGAFPQRSGTRHGLLLVRGSSATATGVGGQSRQSPARRPSWPRSRPRSPRARAGAPASGRPAPASAWRCAALAGRDHARSATLDDYAGRSRGWASGQVARGVGCAGPWRRSAGRASPAGPPSGRCAGDRRRAGHAASRPSAAAQASEGLPGRGQRSATGAGGEHFMSSHLVDTFCRIAVRRLRRRGAWGAWHSANS